MLDSGQGRSPLTGKLKGGAIEKKTLLAGGGSFELHKRQSRFSAEVPLRIKWTFLFGEKKLPRQTSSSPWNWGFEGKPSTE